MKILSIENSAKYSILIGQNLLNEVNNYIEEMNYSNVAFIIDKNVNSLYKNKMKNFENAYIFDADEKNKNLKNLEAILTFMFERKLDRNSLIVSIGGGITGDISGFASGVYMRGIDYIQVPTTLLSQVDSSVGGKTGINFNNTKNILGLFNHPQKVIIDVKFLETLKEKELKSGYGEIFKYGIIKDISIAEILIKNLKNKTLSKEIYLDLIYNSLRIKKEIVEEDEREKGLRKILNFGHTIGHGVEMLDKNNLSHGEAVLVGMYYESLISKELGVIDKEHLKFIIEGIKSIIEIPKYSEEEISFIIDKMYVDKKTVNNKINVVIPVERGLVKIEEDLDVNIINKVLGDKYDF
jgi:3-dehydroquinate synthase